MGDYAIFRDKPVKVGRDGMLFYLRWNQKDLVTAAPGSLAPSEQLEHVWFRAPRTAEASNQPGEDNFSYEGWCGVKPIRFTIKRSKDGDICKFEKDLIEVMRSAPGSITVHNDNIGVDIDIPCCHGYTTEFLPSNMRYSGLNTSTLGVAGIGVRNGRPAVLLGCLACGELLPGYYSLEDLETNCEPFKGEETDWGALLAALRDMGAFLQSGGMNRQQSAPQPSYTQQYSSPSSDDED